MAHPVTLPPKNAIWQWMILPLRRYADFRGRSGRREFWFYSLLLLLSYILAIVLTFVIALAGEANGDSTDEWLGIVVILTFGGVFAANFVPGLALTARRFHDMGLTEWLSPVSVAAVLFFNLFAWIPYLIVMSLPPQKGTNKYGSPVGDEDKVADVFA